MIDEGYNRQKKTKHKGNKQENRLLEDYMQILNS